MDYDAIMALTNQPPHRDPSVSAQVEILVKYSGYIARQTDEIAKLKRNEHIRIPADVDYEQISGLSNEVQQKLKDHRPETLAQAARISGVTPAAISLLLVHLKRQQSATKEQLAS
jgi:tRNA uridine 5-carboxymethylaminomethyl modification enzyme